MLRMDDLPRRPALEGPRSLPAHRRLALGALLATLAAAAIGVALVSRGSSSTRAHAPETTTSSTLTASTTATTVGSFAADVGDRVGCQTLSASEPQLLCPLPGGVVTYTQVGDRSAARRRVDRVADTDADTGTDTDTDTDAGAIDGDPCATGRSGSRAWARPQAPQTAAGAYACRVHADLAEIWWTVDDARLVGHAIRHDGDLAALFSWWRAHSEHP
jgi:hypothetical protein